MPTTLQEAVLKYLRSGNPALGTRAEYRTTITKWRERGSGVPLEQLGRKEIREFLDWVYERAVAEQGTNPGRTANKAREHIRAIISWAWEQDLIESPPRFQKPRLQRGVAGRHYLTKAEINAIYFATHQMKRPRGWECPMPVGRYWRSALVLFFNYGLDTGTIWKSTPSHQPILLATRLLSVAGITCRHYAHRAPLAFKAIMTLPQPTAFSALVKGFDESCPCCRRSFADAARRRSM